MRRVSMATRDELVAAVIERYSKGRRAEKGRILDEFVAVTGFHRKHAMRVLRGGQATRRSAPRPERRLYDEAVHEALIVIWEASDRVCGKRLKALAPILVEAMERHGHLQLAPEVRTRLLAMSAATMDRALRPVRAQAGSGIRRRAGPASAVRRSVPVRTFADWQDPPPGFVEADLVAHSGPSASGSFVQTLVLTDIATGWTECGPLLVREQGLLSAVLTELRKLLPFDLLGFDTDNDSVFMNETVRDYCQAAGIAFTRCRPYRKNDQAFVEQKNGAVVRRIVGYRRRERWAAAAALARLYATVRLFVNFFQPSFKVAIDIGKTRNEVLIEIPGHARRRRLTVLNTRADYDRLIDLLSGLGQPVTCAFEATGNYHRPLAWRLLQAGFTVRLISSLALARTREALHSGWDKNDPKDAQVSLHMLRIGASQHDHDPLAAGLNDIQEVSKTHEAISKAKTEVLHRILTHHLPLYFPEIGRFRHNSRSAWFFAFLDRFPTPGSITALSKEAFIAAAWNVIGRKVSKERLR